MPGAALGTGDTAENQPEKKSLPSWGCHLWEKHNKQISMKIYLQSTLVQHKFEWHGSTYTRIFSTNTVKVFYFPYDFLNIFFSSLLYYKNTVYKT